MPPAVDPPDTAPLFDPVSFVTALDNDALLRVAEAAQAELRRRQGGSAEVAVAPETERAVIAERRQRAQSAAEAALTPGQANAVRAALAAGLSARQVAKRFGVPERAVRQAASR